MIAIIVISEASCFCETIHEQLRENDWKISCHKTLTDAQPLLATGIFDFCLIDGGASFRAVADKLPTAKATASACRFIAICDASDEDVLHGYEQGFDSILPKPLRVNALKTVLSCQPSRPPLMPSRSSATSHEKRTLTNNLDVIRDFSRILSHSLDLPSLIHHFVLKVREMIGVNRVAIFLESPGSTSHPAPGRTQNRLQCMCSIGIPADVQSCLDLSTTCGIGQWVIHSGQILRAENAGSLMVPAEASRVEHEFRLLNCHIAIPINDRERTIGVAMLGGHLTRTGFSDDELQLMFHLMEELGLSVKNNWLHNELAANHRLFSDVLASMRSGSLVVGPELEIIHVNPAMLSFIQSDTDRALSFSDLPPTVAQRVHRVVEEGQSIEPFIFKSEPNDHRTFRVSVIPFQNPTQRLPQSAMVVMEDFTEVENAKRFAVEAANTKLTSLIAKRFAHEIRNSLVPLTTHLQLMDDRREDQDFQASLKNALETETGRISRFTEQMLFLAETRPPPSILTSVEKLLREAFAKAQTASRIKGILTVHNPGNAASIRCNPQALSHAFQEVFINGLQTHPSPPQITVTIDTARKGEEDFLRIAFQDSGPGFNEETAKLACEPFFTSRNTGIGLGLTVASRATREHQGSLDIFPRSEESHPDVTMTFPTTDKHEN